MATFDTVIHRYLKVPYTLAVTEFRSPKRPTATIVLLHGIGNSAHAWDQLIPLLPKSVRIIGVDLLGFGKSPKPLWGKYDATQQARSLGATLLKIGLTQQVILVGHSLGALVAIATAKRYPLLVKQLVLCSPPFYQLSRQGAIPSRDDILKQLYTIARRRPDQLINLSPLVVKFGIMNRSLHIDEENVGAYIQALSASIINQTSLEDVRRLRMPIRILYGSLDPVVIAKHIVTLAHDRPNVSAKRLIVGHEVVGKYTKVLAQELNILLSYIA